MDKIHMKPGGGHTIIERRGQHWVTMRCECGWAHMEQRRKPAKIRDGILRAAVWEHWFDIDRKINKVGSDEKCY